MLRFIVAALVIAAAGTIQIDTKDGGYVGVKVSIHENVPYNESIVENLKVLFRAASKFLHHATNGTVYFKSVRIELPFSWPKRRSARAVSSSSFQRSDVRINLPSKTTGDVSFTQQPRICGKHGDFIHLTTGFLAQTQNMTTSGPDFPAYMLVHEWAHFRYGVFDEFGIPGNEWYPPVYCLRGLVRQNACSKKMTTVEGTRKCSIRPKCTVDLGCKITARLPDDRDVESSIMFLPYMGSKMKYFCDDEGGLHGHNSDAPSMQNEICQQRSTWAVIKEHADFKNLPTPNLSKPIQVDFEEVQQTEQLAQRVVLVLDVSTSMTDYDRLIVLIKAATSYVQNIEDNSRRLAIVSFSTDATTVCSLMLVNGTTRRTYLEEIEKLTPSGYTCIGCGLKSALEELTSSKESAEGGVIVLVTDGEENVDPGITDMLPKLVEAKVIVSTVGLVSGADEKLEELALSTGGKAFSMRDSSWPRGSLLEEIFESTSVTKNDSILHLQVTLYSSQLLKINPWGRSLTDFEVGTKTEVQMSKNHPGAVESRPLDSSDWRCKDWRITHGTGQKCILIPMPDKQLMTNTFEMTLYISSQAVNNTKVTLRNHHPDSITVNLVKPSGQVCNECDITYDGNYTRILLPTPAEVGNWTVYLSSSASELHIETRVTSRVRNTDKTAAVHCEVLSWQLNQPEEAIIYATFTQGDRVFMDAVVYAEVSAPEPLENSTKFRLYDDGRDPDIYADDGTYSGYFSQFSGRGKYEVRVHVGTQSTTRLGHPQRFHTGAVFAPTMSLGTSLNAASGDPEEDKFIELDLNAPSKWSKAVDVQEPVPLLFLVKECGFFSVTEDISYWQLPPAYVSDLKVIDVDPKPDGTLLVQLTWTWPGAHMYIGNASGVTIRASEDFFELKENFDNQMEITSANVVEGSLDPLPPRAQHVVTIALPAIFRSLRSDGEYNWTALIAIRVTNSYGLSSVTSRVVDASHTPQPLETGVTVTTETEVTVTTETEVTVTTETGASVTTETGVTVTPETGVTVTSETGVAVTTETGVTVTPETGVTVASGTGMTVTTETASPTKVEVNTTKKDSEDEEDSESFAWFPLILACILILVLGAVLLAVYITAIRKGIEEKTPDELTGQTSESQEGTVTTTVGSSVLLVE